MATKIVKRRARKNTAVLHKRDKPHAVRCPLCDTKLAGMPRLHSLQLRRLSKTEKRPERVFGGVLCGNCVKAILKSKARLASGAITKKDIDLRHMKYLAMLK